jgi:hypothetical protein
MQHTGNYQQAKVAKFGYREERKVELLLESCYILATFLNLFSKSDDFKILFFFFQNLVTFGTFFEQKFFLRVTLDCFFGHEVVKICHKKKHWSSWRLSKHNK